MLPATKIKKKKNKVAIKQTLFKAYADPIVLQDILTYYLPLRKDTMSNHRSIGMKPFQVTLENASDI